jgi:hypothetical protein
MSTSPPPPPVLPPYIDHGRLSDVRLPAWRHDVPRTVYSRSVRDPGNVAAIVRSNRGGWHAVTTWLSRRQWQTLCQVPPCALCGSDAGAPCVTWPRHGGPVYTSAFPHRPRMDVLQDAVSRVDWRAWPTWTWWAMHAWGEDPDALERARALVYPEGK